MSRLDRRSFLKRTLTAGAVFAIGGTRASGRILGSNETIRVGVAGLHGRGKDHVAEYLARKDVQIACLIDPDTRTFAKRIGEIEAKGGAAPQAVQDLRRALDDKSIDVISIATPNHWHALAAIWAMQAGKDVYVEKPCSHNLHEGRVAVETARKLKRIVQHGTQARSSGEWARIEAIARSGKLGKLLVSRGLCYNRRDSIGVKPPSPAPAEVDFNLWLGPAREQPHHQNLVHYNWHWFWDFGCGDIGNQGVHQMDIARWCIPGATLPRSVLSLGGRFGYQDQGETPNTQMAVFDFGETQLLFEVRGLPSDPFQGEKVGNVFHFEAGTIAGGKLHPKGGGKPEPLPAIEPERKRGQGGGIFGNFLACVRSRKVEELDAEILEGHYSSGLCHLANISYRLGETVPFNPRTKALGEDRETYETLARLEAHLSEGNGLKLEGLQYRLGRKLLLDAKTETITGDPEASKLLTREYRPPFVVPEKVV
jgi:predicted dehydrogenase